ncbi:metallophosphoesterase [Streptomyces sp. NPDC088745]|uniref:metallophosphoesterase n=1 Tax=Streptomyces sp. NPDC088745 TaxID=3365884 RepID=UPI0038133945
MTQGAGQGPAVRTATLRDFRVPPYAQAPVAAYDAEQTHGGEPVRAEEPVHPGGPVHAGEPVHVGEQRRPEEPVHPGEQAHTGRPYVVAQEPYDLSEEPYDVSNEPYAPTPQPYDLAKEPYAPAPAPYVSAHDGYDPEPPFDEGDEPEGYTPTQRDLPVITRDDRGPGDTLRVPRPDFAARSEGEGPGPLFVVGDVHGYLVELLDALHEQGLIDGEGHWSAGNARLWFLGDFTDRGPDGIGVIDLVMRLSAEAAAAGGYCKALMGNHELLLLGARRFGDTPVNSGAGTATFQAAWLLNGGQKHDMERLQDVHLHWMARLDAVALEDGHLLTHSDTTAYLDYGSTIEDVNDTVHDILNRNDADECWDVFRKFTKRFAFRDEGGSDAVRELLAAYGGERIVHGHSPIPYLLGEVGGEDPSDGEGSSGPLVEGPHVYADSLAIAMDGGVTMAGKLLVVQLPLND